MTMTVLSKQMKQKQSAPYWPTSLATLCTTLSNREEEEEEEYEEGVRKLMEENLQLLEEAYKQQNLQQLCGALLGWGERVRRTPATILFLLLLLKSDTFTASLVATLRPLLSSSLCLSFSACSSPPTLHQPPHLCLPCSSSSRNIWRRRWSTR